MSREDFEEYERDENLLEQRRLKRLEMKRKRKIQQRIILGVLAVILILVVVLIAKGCSAGEAEEAQSPQEETFVPPEPVEEETEPDVTATLAAVGDIMMYSDQIAAAKISDTEYDFSSCFDAISPYTVSPDLTVGNLELNFTGTEPYGGNPRAIPYFNAPEVLASNLADIGFDILQTGNTYSIMNGITGLQSTIKFLNQAGIDHIGTHATDPAESGSGGVVLREVNGISFAFIGFTKGVNGMTLPTNNPYAVDLLYTDYNSNYKQIDTTSILERVDAAKATNADVIIAMLHWGSEYDLEISDSQKDIQDLLFRNGVDVILGSHSHVVGPMEMVEVETTDGEKKECFVAYSLGNFISSMSNDDNAYTQDSVILNLEFTKSGETGNTAITDVSYTPLYILDRGEGTESRFEVLPIRNAIKSDMFQEFEPAMTAALEHLKTNSLSEGGVEYDAGN